MKAGTRTSPVPGDITKRVPLPLTVPDTIAPVPVRPPIPGITGPRVPVTAPLITGLATAPVRVRATTVRAPVPTVRVRATIAPVTVRAPAPASMTDAARATTAHGPSTGLMAPVPARTLSFPA